MTITVQNTTKIVELNGVPARVWEGETSSGIKVHCYITRIAVDKDESRALEFVEELQQCATPSAEIVAIPLRLIL